MREDNNDVYYLDGNVGIGTTEPNEKLHIVGSIMIVDGNEGPNKVLTSDANGVGRWQELSISETDPQVGSITTNYMPKWNGSELVSGTIYDNGNVGIGHAAPQAKLDIQNIPSDGDGFFMGGPLGGSARIGLRTNTAGGSFQNEWHLLAEAGGKFHIVDGRSFDLPPSGVERISIATNGNVGIGTTSPGAKLHVNGSAVLQNGAAVSEFSTDGTLSGNSDSAVPTEKAVKTYVDAQVSASTPGVVPIGGVVAWVKSFPNTPPLPGSFVECNGQTLNDPNSPYNGQTIPNVNGASGGTQRFLRGSATSGSLGGTESHAHSISFTGLRADIGNFAGQERNSYTEATATLPSYYEVVWIMRVK